MKKLTVTILFVLAVLAGRLHAQDFAKADGIPLPQWGVVRFDGSGYEHMGYSPSWRSILFRRFGSTEGIGGNPDIDYIFVDPYSGAIIREIPVNFNMFAIGDPSDKEGWAELVQRNEEMAWAAEQEIARITDLDDRTHSDPIYGMIGLVRCVNPDASDLGFNYVYRYYAYNDATGWMKPLHESGEYTSNPNAVDFSRAYLTGFRDEFEWHVLNPEECLRKNYGLANYAKPLEVAI